MTEMVKRYSYPWFIEQFEQAKDTAEKFVLSIDENLFLQPPAGNRWAVAECYSHLIKYGDLFFYDISSAIDIAKAGKLDLRQSFPPRWPWQKVINFFEPPYKLKIKTIKSIKPDPVKGYSRLELLDEYMNLQDRLIEQLENAQHRSVDLGNAKIKHPVLTLLKVSLSESFGLIEAHQRRHQWQAEQTLKALRSKSFSK